MRYSLSPSGRPSAASLRDTDGLDDLEDGRTAHDEDEQRQQPRSHGVLLLGGLGRLGHVAALGDVTAGLLVGHADSLLGSHCSDVFFFAGEVLASYVQIFPSKEERWLVPGCVVGDVPRRLYHSARRVRCWF